jgi:hypothetical protein
MGDSRELRRSADVLELLEDTFAKAYTARADGKISYDQARAYMNDETWFNAKSAVKAGLADAITEPLEMAAKFDLDRYKFKNIPAKVKEKAALPKEAAWRARLASMDMAVTRIQTAAANRQGKNP